MTNPNKGKKHDHPAVFERACRECWNHDNLVSLAKELEIATSSLRDIIRGNLPAQYLEIEVPLIEKLRLFASAHGFKPEGQTQFYSTGPNSAEATHRGQVKTLAALIEICQADLNVWRVQDWEVKPWGVFAKYERTDLKWTEGKADGTMLKGGLETATLWSIKARFVRHVPEPIFPVIEAMTCPVTFEVPEPPTNKGTQRALVIADPHVWFSRDARTAGLTPLHDRRVLDLALQIAIAADVDRIDFIGDLLDMSDWSAKFAIQPELRGTMQPALLETHWWLRQFREARPNARIKGYEGNHDERLRRLLIKHLEAAYGLRAVDELHLPPSLSIPKLLALRELGVEWVGDYPDELDWLNADIALCHGNIARSAPGATARAMAEKYNATVIFGHIHRKEMVTLTRHLGRTIGSGICFGCACHVDGRVPAQHGRQNWQQGFGIVDFHQDGGCYAITHVEVRDGRAIWNGRLFTARNRLPDLLRDLPKWNWQ